MDVREKLVELLNDVQETGVNEIPAGFGCTREYISNENVAQHLISHGVTVQEWISVDDRLPNPFESVLVFRDGKISIDYNEGNGWFAYDFNGKRVTHWMPLPLAPTAS